LYGEDELEWSCELWNRANVRDTRYPHEGVTDGEGALDTALKNAGALDLHRLVATGLVLVGENPDGEIPSGGDHFGTENGEADLRDDLLTCHIGCTEHKEVEPDGSDHRQTNGAPGKKTIESIGGSNIHCLKAYRINDVDASQRRRGEAQVFGRSY
jgi:hypothetical protein